MHTARTSTRALPALRSARTWRCCSSDRPVWARSVFGPVDSRLGRTSLDPSGPRPVLGRRRGQLVGVIPQPELEHDHEQEQQDGNDQDRFEGGDA